MRMRWLPGTGDAAAEEGASDGERKIGWHEQDRGLGGRRAREGDGRPVGKRKKISRTDGDASLATSRKGQRPEPCFKQHTAVDDENGVVLDVAVTTGEAGEGDMIESQVDEVRSVTGHEISTGDRRRGLRLRQGLRRSGAKGDRSADPGEAGTGQEPRAASPVPLRREARHHEVPSGQGAASQASPGSTVGSPTPRRRTARAARSRTTACPSRAGAGR